jgi:cytoskeletal protein CcmA (bactofilin family)
MADEADDLGIPKKLARPASPAQRRLRCSKRCGPAANRKPVLVAAPLPAFLRPSPMPAVPAREPAQSTGTANAEPIKPRSLFVGANISLSGEINSCDRLVVEGSIHANLQACQSMVIRGTGSFSGSATIEDAEIYGRFEGDLVAHKRLLIRAGGQVSGTISYAQIEIEVVGKISGSVTAPGHNPSHSVAAE